MRRRTFLQAGAAAFLRGAPIPDKTVVLTFDDAVKSHRTLVGPLLHELGFRATFFVTQRWMDDKEHFMSWRDIGELHGMGFEVGNHSWTHANFSNPANAAKLGEELRRVEEELQKVGVPKPVSFAWSGNMFGPEAVEVLKDSGYRFARRGGSPEAKYGTLEIGPAFDPSRHHPLLIPTTGDSYPKWTFEHFVEVLSHGVPGRAVVLQFHGVPDVKHPWVHTDPSLFRRYMAHLKEKGYGTMALRDLGSFIDFEKLPADPLLNTSYRGAA